MKISTKDPPWSLSMALYFQNKSQRLWGNHPPHRKHEVDHLAVVHGEETAKAFFLCVTRSCLPETSVQLPCRAFFCTWKGEILGFFHTVLYSLVLSPWGQSEGISLSDEAKSFMPVSHWEVNYTPGTGMISPHHNQSYIIVSLRTPSVQSPTSSALLSIFIHKGASK